MFRQVATVVLIAGLFAPAGRGALAAGPNIAAGRAVAKEKCARCHAIGKTGRSPLAAAPPFRTFSKMWPVENLAEALAEGIMVGHPVMPDFEPMPPRQVDNFIGYLQSIQSK